MGDEVSKAFASQGIMVHTLMLVFGKQRGSCISEFEANLVHKASSRAARATEKLCAGEETKTKEQKRWQVAKRKPTLTLDFHTAQAAFMNKCT